MKPKIYKKLKYGTLKTLTVYEDHATLEIRKNGELQNIITYNEDTARVYGYASLEECIQEKIKSMEG